jgi:putative intracellular protease/amidase
MKIILVLALLSSFPLAASEPSRVLLVAANKGFDMGELAQAHQLFRHNGLLVDIATPAGGAAEPKEYEPDAEAVTAFLEDHADALLHTIAVADVDDARYAAIFIVGGSGAMHEFPSHAALKTLIARMANRGAVIGAVCHGPAALRDVILATGRYLVDGKRVSAFTEEEEAIFGGKTAASYPFVLERALKERGARFEEAPVMLVHVSRDGLLVTGQNPFSTEKAVDEVLRALGLTPKPRRPDRIETTLLLIADILRDADAQKQLDVSPQDYDFRVLGRYGALLADSKSDGELRAGVTLMEAAVKHISNPKLQAALERAHLRLAENAKQNDDAHSPTATPADRRPE